MEEKMIQFGVSPEKQRQLTERMAELGISEADLEERFIRSSGSGGQHVNKSATCVQLTHKPTGLEVKCMRERSQALNRFLARRELAEKVARSMGLATSRDQMAEKIRRNKGRRRRRRSEKRDES